MARVPSKFKAQLITTASDGSKIKRNFNNIRYDISDDDLVKLAKQLGNTLSTNEDIYSMNLTANSSLDVQ